MLRPGYQGDSYAWRVRFPDASYLEGAPENVLAQIRNQRDEVVASWTPEVDGNKLNLSLASIELEPDEYWTDVQVGSTTYVKRTSFIVQRQVSRE